MKSGKLEEEILLSSMGPFDKRMQALVVERANGPFVMTRMPSPTLGAHQVLVRVLASGVNPLDTKIRAGNAAHARVAFPAVLGLDLAGVVERVGYEVNRVSGGRESLRHGGGVGGLQGSLATHIAVDVDLLAPKPNIFSMREAAAMPLAVITAWEGLVDRAHVHEGNKFGARGGRRSWPHRPFRSPSPLEPRYLQPFPGQDEDRRRLRSHRHQLSRAAVESYVAEHTGSESFGHRV